jgi:hypothetical protein
MKAGKGHQENFGFFSFSFHFNYLPFFRSQRAFSAAAFKQKSYLLNDVPNRKILVCWTFFSRLIPVPEIIEPVLGLFSRKLGL